MFDRPATDYYICARCLKIKRMVYPPVCPDCEHEELLKNSARRYAGLKNKRAVYINNGG
jgi:hypothetical protein